MRVRIVLLHNRHKRGNRNMCKTPLWTVTLLTAIAGAATAANAAGVDFDKQIAPIFKDNCLKCHGPDKQKGDLRLDTPEWIRKGAKDADEPTLTPGKPEKSQLYHRISLPKDDEDIMPPKGDPLTKAQQELIKQWITEGAPMGGGEVVVPKADDKAIAKLHDIGALAMPLARNTNLLNVDFRAVADQIGDSHLQNLAPVKEQLSWLNLANTKISDTGLKAIAGFPHLSRLHLEKTVIGDEAIEHIKTLKELEYLNLYGTKVTDKGVDQLKDLKNLKRLYVWQTGVSKDKAAELEKAIPGLRVDTGWEAPKIEPKPVETPKPADAAAAPAPAAAAVATLKPFNGDKCPLSGKDIDPTKTVAYKGRLIAFCCNNCKGKFEKDPDKLIAKVKDFKPAPYVTQFVLIDAKTDKPIRELKDGDTIDLSKEPKELTIEAKTDSVGQEIGSVMLKLNDEEHLEGIAPYGLAGDDNGDFNAAEILKPGKYTLAANAFSAEGGTGEPFAPTTISFTIK
ncbi:MAG: hypothetical protein GC159_14685 [Phycisphaera sp.]|nr:hypothetical protein [Phycisphaera sp.]